MKTKILFLIFLAIFVSCTGDHAADSLKEGPAGKLFIIGGGPRPANLIQQMLDESGVSGQGSVLLLSFASGQEDTALYYGTLQFLEQGIDSLVGMDSQLLDQHEDSVVSALRQASLIYLTGGDQNRFMERINGTDVGSEIREAYQRGATIAGTSAGAAVMSQKMITGNELKHPEYTGDFTTIEADNIELKEGLALDDRIIVDQHFIRRQRMNRLLSVALENPEEICLGIDESTAVIVSGKEASVAGEGQVVVIRNRGKQARIKNGLLGGDHLEVSVLLPGDTIILP